MTENKKEDKQFYEIYYEKIWESYKHSNEKRKKSFYIMFSLISVFFLFSILKNDRVEIPLLKIPVEQNIALTLAPFLIAIFTLIYLYYCVHTLKFYTKYVEYFFERYSKELDNMKITFAELYCDLKLRDISEPLNIFYFPKRTKSKKGASRSRNESILLFLEKTGLLLTIILPVLLYLKLIIWYICNFKGFMVGGMGYLILFFHLLLVIFCFGSLIYFRKYVKGFRVTLVKSSRSEENKSS